MSDSWGEKQPARYYMTSRRIAIEIAKQEWICCEANHWLANCPKARAGIHIGQNRGMGQNLD
jgi:hypothetical protein